MMSKKRARCKGQGLVEYALILVLVAVVAIVIMAHFGLGIERIFGLAAGAVGAKYSTKGSQNLEIVYAECSVTGGKTSVWVRGTTNVPLDHITGSTDTNFGGTIAENDVNDNGQLTGPGTFKYTTVLDSHKADASICPHAVVVQSDTGAIAVWPLKVDGN